ncbi:unannotated protein [freshwater metagenome]|uniref:Unannotated protein n=1 Tax=freshwater metagenome TaxID=449393 RepID=A0A6J7VZW5_9ZZZZ
MQALGLCLRFHRVTSRHNHHSRRRDGATLHHRRCSAQVFDATIGARTNEDGVHLDIAQQCSRCQSHVFKCTGNGFARCRISEVIGGWDRRVNTGNLCWVSSPSHMRKQSASVDDDLFVKLGTFVGTQSFPIGDSFIPLCIFGCVSATFEICKSDLVGGNQSSLGACLNGHVAYGHATFHGQRANCRTAKLNDVADATGGSDRADDCQDHVFGSHPSG